MFYSKWHQLETEGWGEQDSKSYKTQKKDIEQHFLILDWITKQIVLILFKD